MTLTVALAHAADQAGSVSFVIGDATVLSAEGKLSAIARGQAISAGDTVITGPNGHVHLNMIDQAYLSVRPQSRLKIQDYHYEPATPANNRIKFVLEQGVARSITGRAGEASKENYRLNTPLAAIGIRGTDFVVYANADVTRVSVQNGSVVVAPFGEGCLASAFGPCKSASGRVLTAAMRDAYLELRSRSDVPQLMPGEKGLEAPNVVAPPRPEEPRPAVSDKAAKNVTPAVDTREAIREVAADTIKVKVEVAGAGTPILPPAPPATTEGTPVPPVVVVTEPKPPVVTPPVETVLPPVVVEIPPPTPQFWWGRWSSFVKAGEESQSLVAALNNSDPKRTSSFGNMVFGLVRETGDNITMPGSGVAKFNLAGSEAYYMSGDKIVAAATVSSPSLTIDFGGRRFDTSLALTGTGMQPVTMAASGYVTFQGQMFSDDNAPANISGYLSKNASQAGYLFDRAVSGGAASSVVGATRWVK